MPTTNEMLNSWYRFMNDKPAITEFWGKEYPNRVIRTLERFPYPEVALFFDSERLGVLSVLWYNRRSLTSSEWGLVHKLFTEISYNSFCVLQLVKGEICDTCCVHLAKACVPQVAGPLVDMRFGRCLLNSVVSSIVEKVGGGTRMFDKDRQFLEVKTLLFNQYLDGKIMGWDKLVSYIETIVYGKKNGEKNAK